MAKMSKSEALENHQKRRQGKTEAVPTKPHNIYFQSYSC